jgi:sulfatase maturation enzyme AslB (radical SAM superfamily)
MTSRLPAGARAPTHTHTRTPLAQAHAYRVRRFCLTTLGARGGACSHNTDAVSTTEALARRLAEMSGAREATQRSARAELASFSARSDAADPSPEERASTSWRELEQALPLGAPQPHMLTDTFGRHHTYLRISLTERCNLRCTYCMPAEGIDLAPATTMLSKDEIVRIVRLFVEAGVTKVRMARHGVMWLAV